jgi:hypothetical protein
MLDSKHLGVASTSMEVMIQSCGLEDATYLSTLLGSTGAEPQCLPITPSLTCQSSAGDMESTPRSSSTRYQWGALYEAWKWVTPLPNWQWILACLTRDEQFIQQMGLRIYHPTLSASWQSIASTTSSCAKPYLKGWSRATRQGAATDRHDAQDVHQRHAGAGP